MKTDGLVTIRPSAASDAARLIGGRNDVLNSFLGPGGSDPRPTGRIVIDRTVVGAVDYHADRSWLESGEIDVGHHLFAPYRSQGETSPAVQLFMHHLAVDTSSTPM